MFTSTDHSLPQVPAVNEGHCINCPAVRGESLQILIGQNTHECVFDTTSLEARDSLLLEPLPSGTLVLVRRGVLLRGRTDSKGQATWIDAIGSGGAFVVPDDRERAQVYAVDRTLYCTVGPEKLLSSMAQSDKSLGELHSLHREASYRLERYSDARGRPNVRARLAATLCALADTLHSSQTCRKQLPSGLLQRDIAGLASTRHESVCRILKEFSGLGWVEHGPDGITINEYDRLAEL